MKPGARMEILSGMLEACIMATLIDDCHPHETKYRAFSIRCMNS